MLVSADLCWFHQMLYTVVSYSGDITCIMSSQERLRLFHYSLFSSQHTIMLIWSLHIFLNTELTQINLISIKYIIICYIVMYICYTQGTQTSMNGAWLAQNQGLFLPLMSHDPAWWVTYGLLRDSDCKDTKAKEGLS